MRQLRIYLNNGQYYDTYTGKSKEDILNSDELQDLFVRRGRRHLKTKKENLKITDVREL